MAHQLYCELKNSVGLQYIQYAHSLCVPLCLSLQVKLMSLTRIKTEGERGKDRAGRRKGGNGEKQSDVAVPSPWQRQSGAIMHEGCDIDCGITSSADLLKSKHTL